MDTKTFVGVDVGTSRCKAAAIDQFGRVVWQSGADYPTKRGADGSVTQRPADWLRAVRQVLRSAAVELGGGAIEGMALTAPAHVVVLADAAGDALTPAMLAFDSRSEAVATDLRERYGDSLIRATFVNLTAGWSLAQLAWLHQQEPPWWSSLRMVLPQKDWIRYRMTGLAATDPSDAAGTALFDQRAGQWLWDVALEIGLGRGLLPPIEPSTASGGVLSAAWARLTGLRPGIQLVVGATDTAAELLSVGAVAPGGSLVKIASTGTVVGVTASPTPHPLLLTYPHAVPNRWYTLGATNAATVAYQWLRNAVFEADRVGWDVTYEEMDRLAAASGPGARGVMFLPYLQGERTPVWDANVRAAILGLSTTHGRADLARAVMEGVAYALRQCRDVMVEAGIDVGRPALVGGGTRSRVWRDIVAAVLDSSCLLPEPNGPAIGAAMLAAAGATDDPASSVERVIRPRGRIIRPRQAWSAVYHRRYVEYCTAAGVVAPVSRSF